MELAAVLGARAAGADSTTVGSIGDFASGYGVGLQMLDDWTGLQPGARRTKGIEDIRLARLTWPWAWLSRNMDEVGFADLQRQARDLSDDETAGAVAKRMHDGLAVIAAGEVRAHLRGSRNKLLSSFGNDAPAVRLLERDIEALERVYA